MLSSSTNIFEIINIRLMMTFIVILWFNNIIIKISKILTLPYALALNIRNIFIISLRDCGFHYALLIILDWSQKSWVFHMWQSNRFDVFQKGVNTEITLLVLEFSMEIYIYIFLTANFEYN